MQVIDEYKERMRFQVINLPLCLISTSTIKIIHAKTSRNISAPVGIKLVIKSI